MEENKKCGFVRIVESCNGIDAANTETFLSFKGLIV